MPLSHARRLAKADETADFIDALLAKGLGGPVRTVAEAESIRERDEAHGTGDGGSVNKENQEWKQQQQHHEPLRKDSPSPIPSSRVELDAAERIRVTKFESEEANKVESLLVVAGLTAVRTLVDYLHCQRGREQAADAPQLLCATSFVGATRMDLQLTRQMSQSVQSASLAKPNGGGSGVGGGGGGQHELVRKTEYIVELSGRVLPEALTAISASMYAYTRLMQQQQQQEQEQDQASASTPSLPPIIECALNLVPDANVGVSSSANFNVAFGVPHLSTTLPSVANSALNTISKLMKKVMTSTKSTMMVMAQRQGEDGKSGHWFPPTLVQPLCRTMRFITPYIVPSSTDGRDITDRAAFPSTGTASSSSADAPTSSSILHHRVGAHLLNGLGLGIPPYVRRIELATQGNKNVWKAMLA